MDAKILEDILAELKDHRVKIEKLQLYIHAETMRKEHRDKHLH